MVPLDLGDLQFCHWSYAPWPARARTHTSRCHIFDQEATTGRDLFGTLRHLENPNGGVDDVDRVVGAGLLARTSCTGAFERSTPATGDHTGTGAGRSEAITTPAAASPGQGGSRCHRSAGTREKFCRPLRTLLDRGRNSLLAVADADETCAASPAAEVR